MVHYAEGHPKKNTTKQDTANFNESRLSTH